MLFLAGALSSAWLTPPVRFSRGADARMAVAAKPKLPIPELPKNAAVPWALHKFGGASLATPELYKLCADLLVQESRRNAAEDGSCTPTMAIVSARGGVTDRLVEVVEAALVNPNTNPNPNLNPSPNPNPHPHPNPSPSLNPHQADIDESERLLKLVASEQIEAVRELAGDKIAEEVGAAINKDAADLFGVVRAVSMLRAVIHSLSVVALSPCCAPWPWPVESGVLVLVLVLVLVAVGGWCWCWCCHSSPRRPPPRRSAPALAPALAPAPAPACSADPPACATVTASLSRALSRSLSLSLPPESTPNTPPSHPPQVPGSTMELVTGYGEIWSAMTMQAYLKTQDVPSAWLDARDVLVVEVTGGGGLGDKGSSNTVGTDPLWDPTAKKVVDWFAAPEQAWPHAPQPSPQPSPSPPEQAGQAACTLHPNPNPDRKQAGLVHPSPNPKPNPHRSPLTFHPRLHPDPHPHPAPRPSQAALMRDVDCKVAAPIVIVTGFVAATEDGAPTTLKRSGSDYSATIFAKLMDASGEPYTSR